MQSVLNFVTSPLGAAAMLTLFCGVAAWGLARENPERSEQLFNAFLALFTLGGGVVVSPIRRQSNRVSKNARSRNRRPMTRQARDRARGIKGSQRLKRVARILNREEKKSRKARKPRRSSQKGRDDRPG
jgi:hypothetical protein